MTTKPTIKTKIGGAGFRDVFDEDPPIKERKRKASAKKANPSASQKSENVGFVGSDK